MDLVDAKRRPVRPSAGRPSGGRPKPSGGRPKPTGGRPQPSGGRPKPTGGRPKPTVVKPVPGPIQPTDMACMCSLPFPSNTSLEATSRSLVTMLDRFGGLGGLTGAIGGLLTGPVPSVGRSMGDSLPPVVNALITVLLAGLSALAAYGQWCSLIIFSHSDLLTKTQTLPSSTCCSSQESCQCWLSCQEERAGLER